MQAADCRWATYMARKISRWTNVDRQRGMSRTRRITTARHHDVATSQLISVHYSTSLTHGVRKKHQRRCAGQTTEFQTAVSV